MRKESSSLTNTRRSRFFYGYIVVAAALVILTTFWGTRQGFSIFFKLMSEELVWTRAMTAGAQSLSAAVAALSGIVSGRLSDRLGPRKVMTLGGIVLAIGLLLMSQLNYIWQLYLFWGVIGGMSTSVMNPPIMSTISRWFVKQRGLMTAIANSGAGISGMIFAPLCAWLTLTYGWRYGWIILGSIALVFIVSPVVFFKRDPSQVGQLPDGAREEKEIKEAREASERGKGKGSQAAGPMLKRVIRTNQFWVFSVMTLSFGLTRGITVHIAPHITDLGFSLTAAASVLAVNSGVSIAGRLAMGQIADILGSRRALIIGFVTMPAAFLVILFANQLWMLYLYAVLFGLSWGGVATLRFSTAGDLFGTVSLGTMIGIIEVFAYIGGTITPILAGWLFDIMGNYQLCFLIYAAIGMLGFVMSWFLRPDIKTGG